MAPPAGTAFLQVKATYPSGPVELARQFPVLEQSELSEAGGLLLRMLSRNLAEDVSLRDGERENVLLLLIRQVFGND